MIAPADSLAVFALSFRLPIQLREGIEELGEAELLIGTPSERGLPQT